MNENLEHKAWTNEAPVLAAMNKRNPFCVPAGYFENCEEGILSQISLDGLKQRTNKNPFQVPEHYFNELEERITTRISIEQSFSQANKFGVPENYFETLNSKINNRIASEMHFGKQAKIIPLWKRGFVKYASAACFTMILSFGFYFYQNSQYTGVGNLPQLQSPDFANEQLLYDIDETTIIDHLEAQHTTDTKTTSASDTEMENYILNNYTSNDLAQEL